MRLWITCQVRCARRMDPFALEAWKKKHCLMGFSFEKNSKNRNSHLMKPHNSVNGLDRKDEWRTGLKVHEYIDIQVTSLIWEEIHGPDLPAGHFYIYPAINRHSCRTAPTLTTHADSWDSNTLHLTISRQGWSSGRRQICHPRSEFEPPWDSESFVQGTCMVVDDSPCIPSEEKEEWF